MRNATRLAFTAFVSHIALINGVADATEKFVVEPSVQQKLVDKVQESHEFLSKINFVLVDELKGETLGLSVSGTIASRTNTDTTDRATKDPSGVDSRQYECKKTDFDTHIKYLKLDMWAKFPDFQTRIQKQITNVIALDLMRIGFNGTSAAATTDAGAHPNLSDVNIGWLQKLRLEAPAQVMDEGAPAAGVINIGEGGHYATLDSLAYDLKKTYLPAWAKNSTDLIVIVSSDLLHEKYFPLINVDAAPTEQIARDIIMSQVRLGGMPAVEVPHFPDGTMLITTYDNLSIYEQENGHRRTIVDNPKRDRIEDYQSGNYAYVIEDLDFITMAENITMLT